MANQMSVMRLPVSPEKSHDTSSSEETPDCIKITYSNFYYVITWDDRQILVRKIQFPKKSSSDEDN